MPSIFDFGGRDGLQSKMKVSQGSLPPYIDAAQPPTKKSPWHQIKELPFVHTFTMLMPDEMYQMVWTKLDAEVKTIKYAKVIMKLHEVLEGEFFTQFIKKGMPTPSHSAVDLSFWIIFFRDDVVAFSYACCSCILRPSAKAHQRTLCWLIALRLRLLLLLLPLRLCH